MSIAFDSEDVRDFIHFAKYIKTSTKYIGSHSWKVHFTLISY